jgi:hypothetical protein
VNASGATRPATPLLGARPLFLSTGLRSLIFSLAFNAVCFLKRGFIYAKKITPAIRAKSELDT